MDRHEIQKLRELPIEGVAERLGLKTTCHRCLCPFHDDHTPSLHFNTSHNTYRCYACGAHGDAISLAKGVLGGSFPDACRWLANEHNVNIISQKPPEATRPATKFDALRYARYFEHPWLSPEARRFLFDERHLHPAVVRFCRLNSYRDWLQIPYYSQQGQLIGIQRRYMGSDPRQPRFRFPQGNGCHLYNLPVLRMLRQGEDLYITAGCSDCWAMLSAGHKAIAIPSATLLRREELRHELTEASILEKNITLHIYPDNDNPGESLYEQLLSVATETGLCLLRHNLPQHCKDFSDYWAAQALPVTRNQQLTDTYTHHA